MASNVTIDLESATSKPLFLSLWIGISIVYSILGYILMMFLIIRFAICKKFENVMYRLMQVDMMINMSCHLFSMFSIRLESLEFFIPFLKLIEYHLPGSLTLLKKSSFFFLHAQSLSAFFVNLSRLLVVFRFGGCLKTKYPMWCYLVYSVGILSISFVFTWVPFMFIPGNFYEIHLVNGRLLRTRYGEAINVFLEISGCFSTAYFFILSAEAIGVTCTFEKYFKKNVISNFNTTKPRKINITSSVLFSGNFIWSIFQLMNSYFHFMSINVHLNTATIVTSSDMMVFALPIIEVLFDRNVREDCVQVVSCGRVMPKGNPKVSNRDVTTF